VEHWDDNPNPDPLKSKVDALTAIIVVLAAILLLNIVLLWASHDSSSTRLEAVEQAIGLVR
jgi:hypothetical protein